MIASVSYWSLEEGLAGTHPLERALEEVKEVGFEGLELCLGESGELSVETTRERCEEIRALIEASGLVVETVASGMSWGANPVSNEAEVRQRAVRLHEKALERAAWLGCEALLFVPGVVKSPIAPQELVRYDRALERCRENVEQLLQTAHRVGVDLCLENVWNGFLVSPVELAAFVDSFGSERLGVYLDLGNLPGLKQHPPHWIEILGSRIKRVHVKGYREHFDWKGSYEFCELGEGDVPWAESMAALRAVGYDRTVVAEMLPHSAGLLERTSKALKDILAR